MFSKYDPKSKSNERLIGFGNIKTKTKKPKHFKKEGLISSVTFKTEWLKGLTEKWKDISPPSRKRLENGPLSCEKTFRLTHN